MYRAFYPILVNFHDGSTVVMKYLDSLIGIFMYLDHQYYGIRLYDVDICATRKSDEKSEVYLSYTKLKMNFGQLIS